MLDSNIWKRAALHVHLRLDIVPLLLFHFIFISPFLSFRFLLFCVLCLPFRPLLIKVLRSFSVIEAIGGFGNDVAHC